MRITLTTIVVCFSTTFSALLIAATGEVAIPADSGVKQRGNNFFMSLPDNQFRPFAELLITSNSSGCAKTVFFGDRGTYNTQGSAEAYSAEELRRNLKLNQDFCYRSLEGAVRAVGTDTGVFKLHKLSAGGEMSKGGHLFDPRVYERAKKMVGAATTKKKDGK